MNPRYDILTLPIAGLAFRHYQGEQDLPAMLDVFRSYRPTGVDLDRDDTVLDSLDDITQKYRRLTHCDPFQDVLIAEVDGQMIAYGRLTWWQTEASGNVPGDRIFYMAWYIRPEWCGQGLEKAFLSYQQERLRQIIQQQDNEAPFEGSRLFEANAMDSQPDLARLLEENGFQAVRWASKMACHDLENIPDAALPAGMEVRPAKPEHYRRIWDAMLDAFHDYPEFAQPTEEDYAGWQQSSQFQPELWQVAWEGEQVVGMVLNYITHGPASTEQGTAWTEDICVRPHWRGRGLARALLARSMRMFCEMGFNQTSLGVEINNLYGARQLYESMGYRIDNVITIYRKPIDR